MKLPLPQTRLVSQRGANEDPSSPLSLVRPVWRQPKRRLPAFLPSFLLIGGRPWDGKGHIKRTPSFGAKQGFTLTGWLLR